jgi:hypothetical protein
MQEEAAMHKEEAAVAHGRRETMRSTLLIIITARLRVDAIRIQLANKAITR